MNGYYSPAPQVFHKPVLHAAGIDNQIFKKHQCHFKEKKSYQASISTEISTGTKVHIDGKYSIFIYCDPALLLEKMSLRNNNP